MANDYYATLGVPRDASADEVKKAYRRLARELHPDVNPDPRTQERFKEITQAYEVLSDPHKRQMYDLGTDPFAQSGAGPPRPGFSRLSDLLSHLFDAAVGVRRGRDLGIRVELGLAECTFGTIRELTLDTMMACPSCSGNPTGPQTYPRPCDTCDGHGEVSQLIPSVIGQVMAAGVCQDCDGYGRVLASPCRDCNGVGWARTRRTITVRIPAGVQDGTQIQLPGEGDTGRNGGPPGDLFLEIAQRPHPIFERHGDDLHCTVIIPMVAAALGATLSVDSLDGPADIHIRPGTQSGQVIPLYGYGARHLNRRRRGDLVVHVMVETPASLDAEQRQLLCELAMLRGEEPSAGPLVPGQQGRRAVGHDTADSAARHRRGGHVTGRRATSGRARESRGGRARS